MLDIIQQLEADHKKVRMLFDEWVNYPKETCDKLQKELSVHTELEEEVLYPEVKEIDEAGFEHSMDEHHEAMSLMGQLVADCTNEDLFRQLKDAVLHHVGEEEGRIFPEVRNRLTQTKLTSLGKKSIKCKEDLLAKY